MFAKLEVTREHNCIGPGSWKVFHGKYWVQGFGFWNLKKHSHAWRSAACALFLESGFPGKSLTTNSAVTDKLWARASTRSKLEPQNVRTRSYQWCNFFKAAGLFRVQAMCINTKRRLLTVSSLNPPELRFQASVLKAEMNEVHSLILISQTITSVKRTRLLWMIKKAWFRVSSSVKIY